MRESILSYLNFLHTNKPPCHTERSEVSKKKKSQKILQKQRKNKKEIFRFLTKPQYDKKSNKKIALMWWTYSLIKGSVSGFCEVFGFLGGESNLLDSCKNRILLLCGNFGRIWLTFRECVAPALPCVCEGVERVGVSTSKGFFLTSSLLLLFLFVRCLTSFVSLFIPILPILPCGSSFAIIAISSRLFFKLHFGAFFYA